MKIDRLCEMSKTIKTVHLSPRAKVNILIAGGIIGNSVREAIVGDFDRGDAIAIPIAVTIATISVTLDLGSSSNTDEDSSLE